MQSAYGTSKETSLLFFGVLDIIFWYDGGLKIKL